MRILNEKYSISDTVNEMYDDLIIQFDDKIKYAKRFNDWRTNILCSDIGATTSYVNTKNDINENNIIFVFGRIYYPSNEEELKFLKDNNLIYYKYIVPQRKDELCSIRLHTYYYNGDFDYNFYENLQHELNHAYQNINGLIPKNDMYDRVADVLSNNIINDKLIKAIAYLVYCSHKFEQDSIVNGYYRRLCKNNADKIIPFRDSYKNSNYNDFLIALEIFNKAAEDEKQNVYNRLKINNKNFEVKLEKSKDRFIRKMTNAYEKYLQNF